ncbi:hypothetical protein, partial [Cronobacter sakazakii]|uniref:hypothetical protein n=1 Tax=Cronobacter sakazakii TaxID=28141 RepID=UPI001F2351F8
DLIKSLCYRHRQCFSGTFFGTCSGLLLFTHDAMIKKIKRKAAFTLSLLRKRVLITHMECGGISPANFITAYFCAE